MKILRTLLLLFCLGLGALAQDRVVLKGGRVVRGEVLRADEEVVEVVTLEAELLVLAADEVLRIHRGRDFRPAVRERLRGVDPRDPDGLLAVARWALGQRGLREDGRRLLRRIVALDPECEEARELLGQVKAFGRWYPNLRAAYKALKERMEAEGYVYFKRAWVKRELLPYLKQNPADWVRYQNFLWKPRDEVRRLRGDRLWGGEWYIRAEAALVGLLERLRDRVGEEAHAALVGSCVVIAVQERPAVRALAERQQRTREWFVRTFRVAARKAYLVGEPRSLDYVLSSEGAYLTFLEKYQSELHLSRAAWRLSRKTGGTTAGFTYVTHMGRPAWEHGLVSALGLRMMTRFYTGRAPDWLKVAAGHLAELHILGDVRVQWVHTGGYGRGGKLPPLQGRRMADLKPALRETFGGGLWPGIRVLMGKDMNDLTPELDLLGTAYLQFLLEKHREGLLDFLTSVGLHRNVRERFERHFKLTYEAMDRKFRAWAGG